jgi:exodeoxyribonuclease VII large subunit
MPEPSNAAEYTVSELSFALRRTIEDGYEHVRVRGEISGYRGPHGSGHAYFCLKDEGALIDAVVWRTTMQRLRFKPEEGLEVVATGKVTTYPGKSKYQIVVEALEPAGAGALMALLEERRKRLAAEGLFDVARKRPLPSLPRVVGVVTSPTGAVIRDILHRLAERFPTHVVVWPVRVQGETAAAEVAAAIQGFNALEAGGPVPRPDVLIVARGGGSLEDLWPFNEEVVVRAAAASAIPLVSAVGHETDTTLIDHASDRRAPTPTAAAEIVLPVRAELLDRIAELGLRLGRGATRLLTARRRELSGAARALPRPEALLALPRQRLDGAAGRLPRALVSEVTKKRLGFARAAARFGPELAHARLVRARTRLEAPADRLGRALRVGLERRRERLDRLTPRLSPELPRRTLLRGRDALRGLGERARRCAEAGLERRRARLDGLAGLLRSLSYRSVLDRGFALVRGPDGRPVRSAAEVSPGARLGIELAEGRLHAFVEGGRPRPATGRDKPPTSGQDDLFG